MFFFKNNLSLYRFFVIQGLVNKKIQLRTAGKKFKDLSSSNPYFLTSSFQGCDNFQGTPFSVFTRLVANSYSP